MSVLYDIPQYKTTTLNTPGNIDASQTTGIILADVTGVDTAKPGIACLSWANPLDITKAEFVTYTSIDGTKQLVGVTRAAEGLSAKTHSNGDVVGFVVSKSHINLLNALIKSMISGSALYGVDGGSTDDYAITVDSLITAYAPGLVVVFKANTINTGPATLNVNALGAKTIKKNSSVDLSDGDIAAGQIVTVIYDGTYFQLQSQLANPGDAWTALVDGATVTIDLSIIPSRFEVTLGGNRTLALSNIPTKNGRVVLLRVIQDGTGSRTLTYFSKSVTVTMTIATPGVVTLGLDIPTGTPIIFTTTGALPTGVTAGTTYYWIRVSATTGNIATTLANALAGTAIATSGSQSGVHTGAVQVKWSGGATPPTLTTGKYRADLLGFVIRDVVNGVYEGYVIGQDV